MAAGAGRLLIRPRPHRRPPEPALYDQVSANKRRSLLLTAAFVASVVAGAWALSLVFGYGVVGVVVGVVAAAAASFGAWWKSDAVALALSHARPATEADHARLHNLVEGLCIAGGLPKPRLYVVPDAAPNAFATGRNPHHAAVAVTTGLLEKLNRVELEGVLAHELSHVKNYDTLVSTLAVTLVGVVTVLSDLAARCLRWGGPRHRDDQRGGSGPAALLGLVGIVLVVAAPLVGRLMHFAVSRRRELLADVSGVALTRYPPGLISALEKLRDDATVVHSGSRASAHLWIESPLSRGASAGSGGWIDRLFDTHPPLDERIAALREL